MKSIIPTKSVAVLMLIGFTDLVVTAVLHRLGLIREMNPLMRVFLEHGEWAFIAAKSLTLLVAWYALATYSKKDLTFVNRASIGGCVAYVALWCSWFFAAR